MTRLVSSFGRMFVLALAVCLGLSMSTAYAAPKKASAADKSGALEAKEHAANGYRLYGLGKYIEASAEFEAAYSTRPDGGLLYNAAQSARLGGDLRKARTLYSTYVSFHPDAPNVGDAKSHLERLDQQIQLEETAKKNAPTTGHVDQSGNNGTGETGGENGEPKSDAPKPLVKKGWFWGAIVGGIVVVGGAVTLGVLLSRPAPKWSNVPDIGRGAPAQMSAPIQLRF